MPNLVRTKIFNCGAEHKEVEIFFAPPDNAGRKRRRERTGNPTDERKQANNKKMSEKKLRHLLKTNFSSGFDYYATLTFDEEHLPETYDETAKLCCKFFRNLRLSCKRKDITLRWIFVIEVGENGRFHAHSFINGEVPEILIQRLWSGGNAYIEPISKDADQIAKLAAYSVKAPQGKHGWHASNNIKQPDVETDDKLVSHSLFASVAYSGFNYGDVAELVQRLFPGFVVTDFESFYCAELMSPFLWVSLQKQTPKQKRNGIDFADLFGCSRTFMQHLASYNRQQMTCW